MQKQCFYNEETKLGAHKETSLMSEKTMFRLWQNIVLVGFSYPQLAKEFPKPKFAAEETMFGL